MDDLKSAIRDIPGFPKEGIIFKDITTLLRDKDKFRQTVDLFAEKFKGVRQGMADRKSQRPQPERVQKNGHLMPHAHRAVLEVAVIKAEAGIENDFPHAVALRNFNLPRKITAHHFDRIGTKIEIADFADVLALSGIYARSLGDKPSAPPAPAPEKEIEVVKRGK